MMAVLATALIVAAMHMKSAVLPERGQEVQLMQKHSKQNIPSPSWADYAS